VARLVGGRHHGAIDVAAGEVVERAVRLATELGVPLFALIDSSGADVTDGVAALHAWGRCARALADASGVVPVVVGVTGAAVSGPALMLGLADHVLLTPDAFAYLSGPDQVAAFTGEAVDHRGLGGAAIHDRSTGLAAQVVPSEEIALAAHAILSYLPSHHLDDPPYELPDDPLDRPADVAAATVPTAANLAYDVRTVIDDITDRDSFLELYAGHAPNLVVGYGRLGGHAVGVVANQPAHRAGTLDLDASRKGARFVQMCDAFNVPLVTFVDTPGYEPGRDLEWRGIIRYGAQLVHAYCSATVPRLGVVLRKAYGGAYIVMDSRGIGNDFCVAWPGAEIAVMGAPGAVQILHGRELRSIDELGARASRAGELQAEYEAAYLSPRAAAERGYVDAVVRPAETRAALGHALATLVTKREPSTARRHSNPPL